MTTQIMPIARWTTQDVPTSMRYDYFAAALSSAIVPMRVAGRNPKAFESSMTMLELGDAAILHQVGSPHRSFRRKEDLARSGAHTFHFILNRRSDWTMNHRQSMLVRRGEGVLVDSAYGNDIHLSDDYDVVHIKLGEAWMRRWVPNSASLVGTTIGSEGGWGRTLAAFVGQLSPQYLSDAPLSPQLMLDQVGALMALAAAERGSADSNAPCKTGLADQIRDCISQRSAEAGLTAADVARAMNIDERALHRALGAAGTTFASTLLDVRVCVSCRMLASPAFAHLSLTEISARAGYTSPRQLVQGLYRRNRMDDRLRASILGRSR